MILLANPNANAATTARMCEIAAPWLPDLRGWTAPDGPDVIQTPDQLTAAGHRIAALAPPAGCRGVIVAAFGDPGADRLAARLDCPVVGIGAAAARAARGRPFAVATTTPHLGADIDASMQRHAQDAPYLGCFLTQGPTLAVMSDPERLDRALLDAVHDAARAGAQVVIIGGGPLAQAAERIATQSPRPLIQPIPEAARLMAGLLT
ncbi:aspartate/glutamate racemase family protein [Paracoccus indicus]|uniref:aspartate/glutamate racemase family protein n=1 Tax=Paracoccus indicus TaxID=2079229 RepID=UPI000D3DB280|nr:aspartate/glutamate racemase family protein [Paracoccus indicus]